VKQLPADWRCTIAYNAALQAATAALAADGYRAARDNHHYRVIQALEFTTAPGRKFIDTLDGFRKKRNVSSYDLAGAVSDMRPTCEPLPPGAVAQLPLDGAAALPSSAVSATRPAD
jgi:hypothetical protein